MNTGKIVFSQLMDFIPKYEFRKIVKQHKGNHRVKSFNCWDQLLCMCFAQLTFRQSLIDVEQTLASLGQRCYHMGIRTPPKQSTLADANARRPWQIYQELAWRLIDQARLLYRREQNITDTANHIYALDSTIIDLCLSLFPWARFHHNKGAIKLHTLMDLEGSIPTMIHISDGLKHDVNMLDHLWPAPGDIYIMDRGYVDYYRLAQLDQAHSFFVIRAKKNMKFYRKQSRVVDRSTGLICDQSIRLCGIDSKNDYKKLLRRVHYYDHESEQDLVILSNMFTCSAGQICQYYKQRWQIELFFKWIKQNLRIKNFYGRNINAVKTQIWTAICSYLIIAIVRKTFHFDVKMHTMMRVLSVTLLERMELKSLFLDQSLTEYEMSNPKQLGLFDF